MIAIPCVELRRGLCIRPKRAAEASDQPLGDPIGVARSWAHAGYHRIHLVDVDAATGGDSNEGAVDDVIRDGAIEVQASCSPQSTEQIELLVSAGAVRVVVGPRGLDEPEWLEGAADMYPGLLVVATDVRERKVVTRGWVRNLPLDLLDLVAELSGLPLGGLLVSSALGDSPRTGADLSLLEDVAESCEFPLIVAGGVSTMNDLRALQHRGVAAVLLGEPLYAGTLDPRSVSMEFSE